jgi:2-C-methyl-D-erythritol 4-phosphate cytidylyltransferase / 2-C-methyl-D-erythritol 2,4-cyclodiphosphate synthase
MRVAALIVAAGRGRRAGSDALQSEPAETPKQYRPVGGVALLARSIKAFVEHDRVDEVVVVIHRDDRPRYGVVAAPFAASLRSPVAGGPRRQDSVRAGLEALAGDAPDKVLIHDAARPFADAALIGRVIDGLNTHMAALPCLPVTDTLKRAENGVITATLDRAGLLRAQTPQGFSFAPILKAHRAAAEAGLDFTDDASIAEWYGLDVAQVEGAEANRKFTTAEDFVMAEAMLRGGNDASLGGIRIGTGYDVHRLEPGDGVMLAGVLVPHDKRLVGHSDADVVLHALTDALLGAIADGDIGVHFPPSEARWRGADSALFVVEALRRVKAKGGAVLHADITLLCERPKIGAYRDAMRARIAELLELGPDRVGLKATTHEGLGALGRGEGIAAMATVTVNLG